MLTTDMSMDNSSIFYFSILLYVSVRFSTRSAKYKIQKIATLILIEENLKNFKLQTT